MISTPIIFLRVTDERADLRCAAKFHPCQGSTTSGEVVGKLNIDTTLRTEDKISRIIG